MALIFISFWALMGGTLCISSTVVFGLPAALFAPIVSSVFGMVAGAQLFWLSRLTRRSEARLSRVDLAAIGARLRSVYATVVEQPIPDRLTALTARLIPAAAPKGC